MIPPRDNMSGKLVIQPPNIFEFCSSSIGFIEGVREEYPLIAAQIQIGSHGISGIRTLALSLDLRSEVTAIPRDWLNALIVTLRETTGVDAIWNTEEEKFLIPNCPSSLCDQLPVLTFSIRGVVTDDPIHLALYPEDYFVDCKFMLQGTHAAMSLGRPLLDNVGIIVDDTENRIGFCDPN